MGKPRAVASGVLQFGAIEVDCYVLDNGKRVLSQRGIIGVLSGRNTGNFGRSQVVHAAARAAKQGAR